MTEIRLTAAAALARVLKTAEQPSAHILIVVPNGICAERIRDAIFSIVKGVEYRRAQNTIAFPTGSWITFLLARNVRPERLLGHQAALSWAYDLERMRDLPASLLAEWMHNLSLVTRVGDTPDVLISGDLP